MIKNRVFIGIILLTIIPLLLFTDCSHVDDLTEVKKVIASFYNGLNDRDYKQLESLMTANMRVETQLIRDNINDFVLYEKINVKEISINTLTARVTVECTDEFANVVEQSWDLIKENNNWKINNFNSSKAQSINIQIKNGVVQKEVDPILTDSQDSVLHLQLQDTTTENIK
ncbi:MAG: hypothetical protein ACTTJH_03710 [Bacteroidales bacterium]